jgi:molybdopterin molybdotransferase
MLSVEEALARVLAAVPVLGSETVELTAALGRVLAEPVAATRDLPPWDNSSMDGYALRAADTAGATVERPARLRLLGDIPAGAVADRPLGGGVSDRRPMPRGGRRVPRRGAARGGVLVSG